MGKPLQSATVGFVIWTRPKSQNQNCSVQVWDWHQQKTKKTKNSRSE